MPARLGGRRSKSAGLGEHATAPSIFPGVARTKQTNHTGRQIEEKKKKATCKTGRRSANKTAAACGEGEQAGKATFPKVATKLAH